MIPRGVRLWLCRQFGHQPHLAVFSVMVPVATVRGARQVRRAERGAGCKRCGLRIGD